MERERLEGRPEISKTLIGVITVTKDNFNDFKVTATSISGQTRKADKVVVVDSSHTTNAEKVKKLCRDLGFRYLWQQPIGVYGAMNLGLRALENIGWVQFLNSGDFFSSPRALEQAVTELEDASQLGRKWALGSILLVDEPKAKIEVSAFRSGYWPVRLGLTWFPHPSTFYEVGAIRQIRGFTDFAQIAADYYAGLLFFRQYGKPHEISAVIAAHYLDGISNVHPVSGALEGAIARVKIFGPLQILIEMFAQLPLFLMRRTGMRLRAIRVRVSHSLSKQSEWEPELHFCEEGGREKSPPFCCADFLGRHVEG